MSNIIVVQQSAGKYAAFAQACGHACALVDFTGNGFRCPRHGAKFDMTGACTNGISPTPLQELTVCADANGVYVTLP
jgi:cytochrome b6-f complex iron-sulfur subunit